MFTFTIACGLAWSEMATREGAVPELSPEEIAARRARITATREYDPSQIRRSPFVGIMRVALPALAIVLLVTIFIWPQFGEDQHGFALTFGDQSGSGGTLAMIKARYFGTDRRGQPFLLTADAATPAIADAKTIILDAVTADVTISNGTWIWMSATTGAFQQEEQILILHGGVSVYTDIGYEFHGKTAEIEMRTGSMRSNHPIVSQGPLGRLRADAMRIYNRGERMEFIGRVHVSIYPQHKAGV